MSGCIAAVNAGLGITAIDRCAVLPTMQVLKDDCGLPPLPVSEIVVLRRVSCQNMRVSDLVRELWQFTLLEAFQQGYQAFADHLSPDENQMSMII
jgi:DNA-binding transcriptional LysR family regulator